MNHDLSAYCDSCILTKDQLVELSEERMRKMFSGESFTGKHI